MKQQQQNNEIKITHREQQIIALLMQDYSHKLIASYLHIAKTTVDKIVQKLREKLNVHSGARITAYALTHGFTLDFESNKVYYHQQLID